MSKRERTVWLVVFVVAAALVTACLYLLAASDPEGGPRASGIAFRTLLAFVGIVLVPGALLFAALLRWFLLLKRRERERNAEAVGTEPPP